MIQLPDGYTGRPATPADVPAIHRLVAGTFLVCWKLRWRLFSWTTFFAFAASIPPFFTVRFEVWVCMTGRLELRPVAAERERVGV